MNHTRTTCDHANRILRSGPDLRRRGQSERLRAKGKWVMKNMPVRRLKLFTLLLTSLSPCIFAQQVVSVPQELVSYPETIVVNGKIVTMDNKEILSADPGSIVDSMALRDEKVFAVGSRDEMMRLAGPETRIIDVRGKTVIPGIIETHVHPETTVDAVRLYEAERDAYSLPPGLHTAIRVQSNDAADTLNAIRAFVSEFPPRAGEWVHIRLLGNDSTNYPDIGAMTNGIYNDFITTGAFSEAIPDNPATLGSGGGPSAIQQEGLVVRVTVGPDGKAELTPVHVPKSALQEITRRQELPQDADPFEDLVARNAEQDRVDSFHAHLDQGCGFAELYPHHMQHCSHRLILINEKALEITREVWPGFIKAANDMTGLSKIGNEGSRGIVGGVFQENAAWERSVFPSRIPEDLYVKMLKESMKLYNTAGVTMIASSIEQGSAVTAAFNILRRDKRLPVRWGYGFEMFRSPLLYPVQAQLVSEFGAHRSTPKVNPWFWPMGITDGGAGDSRQVACFGDDLPGPEMLKRRELCWEEDAYRLQNVMVPAVAAGWRPFSLHAFGSEAFRKHVKWIEQGRIAGGKSMDEIRELRIGFAHGGAVGKLPDVIALMKRYNLYIPIQPNDVAASLVQVKRYGPEGLQFLAPTKTLLEAGVNVVGETEYSRPRPDIYFNALDMFVNRRIRHESAPAESAEIVMPEEAVSRATALRLYTTRAAEWLFAEDVAGSLEPGKFADFTVLERDYFTVPSEELLDNKVIMTVVGDKIMYVDPDYEPQIAEASASVH